MLTRQFLARSRVYPSTPLVRTFTTSQSINSKVPTLANVVPTDAAKADFDARVEENRKRVQAAKPKSVQKQAQEEKESQLSSGRGPSKSGETPTAPDASNASASSSLSKSVATAFSGSKNSQETSATDVDPQNADKKKGALSSLIYGTHEGQQLDQEIEQSFSKVLARGKYVHSIVFHQVRPDKVDEYVELVGGWYPKVAADPANKVHLVGSWRTEVGDCDTFGSCPALSASAFMCSCYGTN
jgi:hypothetical protein